MYSQADSSNGETYMTSTICNTSGMKGTQNISPHIAAHKSSSAASQQTSMPSTYINIATLPSNSAILSQDLTTYKIISHPVASGHSRNEYQPVNTGRLVAQSINNKDCIISSLSSDNMLVSASKGSVLTNLSCVVPEDLSTATEGKIYSHSSSAVSSHRPLPHIYTVAGQVSTALFPNIIERTNNNGATYFRSTDSPNLTGQPQAILVPCADTIVDHSNSPTPLAAMPAQGTMNEQVINVVETRVKREHDIVRDGRISQQRMLQLAVPYQKNSEEVIEYHYNANDIADILMLHVPGAPPQAVRQINGTTHLHNPTSTQLQNAHSSQLQVTSTPQLTTLDASVTPVIMMPAGGGSHISAEVQSQLSSLNSSAHLLPPGTILTTNYRDDQATTTVMTEAPPAPLTPKAENFTPKRCNKSTKLSDEEQAIRRQKLAVLMREKRANESDEQKIKRRRREAERMRRRRSMEDEEQKHRRREEAAQRARLRRASMTAEQRIEDRKKAAERMRLRRLNECQQIKMMRRKRAAERMRLRRAEESSEQRAKRRHYSAQKMKNRRGKKSGTPDSSFVFESPSNLTSDSNCNEMRAIGDLMDMEAQDLSNNFTNTSIIYPESKEFTSQALANSSEHLMMPEDQDTLYIGPEDMMDNKQHLIMSKGYGVITSGALIDDKRQKQDESFLLPDYLPQASSTHLPSIRQTEVDRSVLQTYIAKTPPPYSSYKTYSSQGKLNSMQYSKPSVVHCSTPSHTIYSTNGSNSRIVSTNRIVSTSSAVETNRYGSHTSGGSIISNHVNKLPPPSIIMSSSPHNSSIVYANDINGQKIVHTTLPHSSDIELKSICTTSGPTTIVQGSSYSHKVSND